MITDIKNVLFIKTVQTITYLPHFLSWTIIAGLTITILSPNTGVVNSIIKALGFQPIYFIIEPKFIRTIITSATIWKEVGFGAIIYIAAIIGIDQQLYEAAKMDGANKIKQILHVTLPGIMNIIVMQLIFRASNLFAVAFDPVYNLMLPTTYSRADVITTYIYRIGIAGSQYSFSSAVGLASSVIALIMIVLANKVAKRYHEEGAVW